MPYNIKARLAVLGRTCTDVIEEMSKRGLYCTPPQFSLSIGRGKKQEKHCKILELANEIISEWENKTTA